MIKTEKSNKQLLALTKQRNVALGSVETLNPSFKCQGKVGDFIDCYLMAEVFARKIQKYYCVDLNKKEKDKVLTPTLIAAITHLNLSFNKDEIKLLFQGGSGLKGTKSARQLRNGYLHSLSINDKLEIIENHQKYKKIMLRFLNLRV